MKPEKNKKYYTLISGRPIGVHPTVFLTKPKVDYGEPDPWTPEIQEHGSIKDALLHIIDFNGTDEYLKHVKLKDVYDETCQE